MNPAVSVCLASLYSFLPSQTPTRVLLNEAGPTVQAMVDRYDLTAVYGALPPGANALLVIEQVDQRNFLWARVSHRGSQLWVVRDGRRERLAMGSHADFARQNTLAVRRRPGRLTLFSGSQRLLEAYVDFRPGLCGVGVGAAEPIELRLQEVGDIAFDDDFSVGEEREGLWEHLRGRMTIDIYWDPKQRLDNQSIGASWFANQGAGEHLVVTGFEFWDDYSCEVSVRPDRDSTVGLALRVQDISNYVLMTLSAHESQSVLRLVEVRNGVPTVLAESPATCRAGRWYRLRAEVWGSEARGWAADESVGPAILVGPSCGRVGVFANTQGDCRFDDFCVRSVRRGANLAWQPQPLGPWRFLGGAYRAKRTELECRTTSTALAVAKVGEWQDAQVEAEVDFTGAAEAGVLGRWSESGGYGFLARKSGTDLFCRLALVGSDGSIATLSEATAPKHTKTGPVLLRLVACGAALRGFVNSDCVVRAWNAKLPTGESGLLVRNGRAIFRNLTVAEAQPEDLVSELFADGTDQSRPGADHGVFEPFIGRLWKPEIGQTALVVLDQEPAIMLRGATLRYYCFRPGDVYLATDVLECDGRPLSLIICGDTSGQQGYALGLHASVLRLSRNGQLVAEAPAPKALPLRLSLRRDGPFIIGQAGSVVLPYKDSQPLPSGYALVQAAGETIIDNLDVGGAHALAYRFDRVEPDWLETSGEWIFHSGMACIPWNYWLTGDGRQTPAVLWNRRKAPENLTVRFDVSEYTEGYESGEHQHFPYHHISLVLSGDRNEPDSGYRFVIGADGGRVTRLLRKGQVVAETSDPRFVITTGSSNVLRAVEVIAAKNAGDLMLWLNGILALTYTDSHPLGPGWVAIGVEKCRANFRDLFIYRERTWEEPLGVTAFSPAAFH